MKTVTNILLFAAIFVGTSEVANSQGPATPEVGANPFKVYSGGNLDHIQVQNGTLFLKIPLVSFPQKGKLDLSFSIISNGSQYQQIGYCDVNWNCVYTYAYVPPGSFQSDDAAGPSEYGYYIPGNGNSTVVLDQDVSLVGSSLYELTGQLGPTDGTNCETACPAPTSYNIEGYWFDYFVVDSTGAGHNLGYNQSEWNVLQANDGSGYTVDLPYANSPEAASPTGAGGPVNIPLTIYDDEGTKHSWNYDVSGNTVATISDPIGNSIVRGISSPSGQSLSNIVDSVGRSIPDPIDATIDSDTSACPNLGVSGQPAVQSKSWTVPGPDKTPVTYHFCYANVFVNTDFFQGGAGAKTDVPYAGTGPDGNYDYWSVQWNEISATYQELQAVVLPNGTYWGFVYQTASSSSQTAYGDLIEVILPSGGSLNYVYGNIQVCGYVAGEEASTNLGRAVMQRTSSPVVGSSVTTTYNYLMPQSSTPTVAYTVETDSLNNDIVHQFNLDYNEGETCGAEEVATRWYYGSSNSATSTATPLREIDTTFNYQLSPQEAFWTAQSQHIDVLPQTKNTYQNGQLVKSETFGYDTLFTDVEPYSTLKSASDCCQYVVSYSGIVPQTATISYQNATTHSDGIDTTTTHRLAASNPGYANIGLLNIPQSVTVSNGTESVTTTYAYDETGSPQGYFGNQTSVVKEFSTTHTQYNSIGMPCMLTDANGNTTSLYYYGASPSGSANGCTATPGLYVTGIQKPTTNGINHITSYQEDFNTGRVKAITDENGNTTSYGYDVANRLTSVEYPDGGEVIQCYSDTGGSIQGRATSLSCSQGTVPYIVLSSQYQNALPPCSGNGPCLVGPVSLKSSSTYDGLGRIIASSSPTGATTETVYDAQGHIQSVSNPHFGSAYSSDGYTSYLYDALNRKTTQCNPDNQTPSSSTCNPANSYRTWSYNGNSVTYTDEEGNSWTNTTDARNRLIQVVEPGKLTSTYTYDALDNLSAVNQAGTGSETARNRSFTFDSESRLMCAANPEASVVGVSCPNSEAGAMPSGALIYTYDANGNVHTKTDARDEVITYSYDALSRVTSKAYSDGLTPTASYTYDSSPVSNAVNTIGRLTQEKTLNSNQVLSQTDTYAYDNMGRALEVLECTPTNCAEGDPFHLSYRYDFAGHVIASTNGIPNAAYTDSSTSISSNFGNASATINGISVPSILYSHTYDGDGRLQTLQSSYVDSGNHPDTLFAPNPTQTQYGPVGLLSVQLGYNTSLQTAVANQSRTYDDRLRRVSETDLGTTNVTIAGSGSSGSITITGTEQSKTTQGSVSYATLTVSGSNARTICTEVAEAQSVAPDSIGGPPKCTTSYLPGTVSLNISGAAISTYTASINYSGSTSATQIATALATQLNNAGSPVTAFASNGVLTITSIAAGAAADYSISCSSSVYTIATCPASMTGGSNGGVAWDTGNASATLSSSGASVGWGQSDDAMSVATNLGNALVAAMSGAVSYQISGADPMVTLNLTSTSSGSSTNWSLVCGANDSASQTASFSIACNGMSGGVTAYSGPQKLYSYSIPSNGGYDSGGNLKAVTDSVIGTWSYAYDGLNRLTSASMTGGTYGGMNFMGSLSWSYDSFGNSKGQISSIGNFPSYLVPEPGADNRGMSDGTNTFGYDNAGDQTTTNSVVINRYDAEGRLCATLNSAGGATGYIYDASGTRVAKVNISSLSCDTTTYSLGSSSVTSYIVGIQGEQVTQVGTQIGQPWAGGRSYVYGAGDLLATYEDSDTYFAFNDWLGTKRFEETPDGLYSETASLPYGDLQQTIGTASDAAALHFTGKERDTESGLDYFGARYLNSGLGRWMSPDWSDPAQPVPYAHLDDPQSLNLYGYVGNNPLSQIDDDGHSTVIFDGQAGTITVRANDGTETTFPASNNPQMSLTIGKLVDGNYAFLDTTRPHHHSPEEDSHNGAYGPGGIFRLKPFKGADGKEHDGVGLHAGRADSTDRAGRSGCNYATNGCVRTTERAIQFIINLAPGDPLTDLEVRNNRKPPKDDHGDHPNPNPAPKPPPHLIPRADGGGDDQ